MSGVESAKKQGGTETKAAWTGRDESEEHERAQGAKDREEEKRGSEAGRTESGK